MAVSVDDAFLSSLLDDLDPDAFNAPPSSTPPPPPPRRSPSQPTRSKLVHKPKAVVNASPRRACAGSPLASSSRMIGSGAGAVVKGPREPAVLAQPTVDGFWDKLDAGKVSVGKPLTQQRAPIARGGGGMSRHQPGGSGLRKPSSTALATPPRKAPRPVDIGLDRDDSKAFGPSAKGKGKVPALPTGSQAVQLAAEDVDMDALCDGMDWEGDMTISPVKPKQVLKGPPPRAKPAQSVSALCRHWRTRGCFASLRTLTDDERPVAFAGPTQQAVHALHSLGYHQWHRQEHEEAAEGSRGTTQLRWRATSD